MRVPVPTPNILWQQTYAAQKQERDLRPTAVLRRGSKPNQHPTCSGPQTTTMDLETPPVDPAAGLGPGTAHAAFVLSAVLFGALTFGKSMILGKETSTNSDGQTPAFKAFQRTYLTVYLLMMAGDWLQGPYMYALYDAYGFAHEEIAALFVAGFGSSMLFGTVAGSLADTLGRKRGALAYVVVYALSCVTKHWRSYEVLMLGRVLGGIATSLLFSVFDSWLVAEHAARGFEPAWCVPGVQFAFTSGPTAYGSGSRAHGSTPQQALHDLRQRASGQLHRRYTLRSVRRVDRGHDAHVCARGG